TPSAEKALRCPNGLLSCQRTLSFRVPLIVGREAVLDLEGTECFSRCRSPYAVTLPDKKPKCRQTVLDTNGVGAIEGVRGRSRGRRVIRLGTGGYRGLLWFCVWGRLA